MKIQKINAFTLVELIVVIGILSILSTISFLSYSKFVSHSRDSNRIVTLKNVEKGLNIYYNQTGFYPDPDNKKVGKINGTPIIYTGLVGNSIINYGKINGEVLDPLTKNNYLYGVSADKKYYQLSSITENKIGYLNFVQKAYAKNENTYVLGNYKGIYKEGDILYPIPSLIVNGSGSEIDLQDENTTYIVNNGFDSGLSFGESTQLLNGNSTLQTKVEPITYIGAKLEDISDTTGYSKDLIGNVIYGDKYIVQTVSDPNIVTNKSCGVVKHGETKIFFKTQTVSYGNTCDQAEFLCDNGAWVNNIVLKDNYSFNSCSEDVGIDCISQEVEGYNLEGTNHLSTISVAKTTSGFLNGTKTYNANFKCENGVFTKQDEIFSVNCNSNYVNNNDICILDNCSGTIPQNAEINGTQGTNTWSYSELSGVCKYKCSDNYHTENSGTSCISNTKSCSIINGTGEQVWSGNAWGNCLVSSCDANYHLEGNDCISNTKSCVITNGTGIQTWNTNSWSICTVSTCDSGYTKNGNSCDLTCPSGYVLVPKNTSFAYSDGSVGDFCVAKYEMKNVSGIPKSQAALTGRASVTQQQAIDLCRGLGTGYHLITNNERMTIARNMENVGSNWSSGIVKNGFIYHGNATGSDFGIAAGTDAGELAVSGGSLAGDTRRALVLSNGSIVWDLSGNYWEHVDRSNNKNNTVVSTGNGTMCGTTMLYWSSSGGPSDLCGSSQGPLNVTIGTNAGLGYVWPSATADRVFMRGAPASGGDKAGIFSLGMTNGTINAYTSVGFRCVYSK